MEGVDFCDLLSNGVIELFSRTIFRSISGTAGLKPIKKVYKAFTKQKMLPFFIERIARESLVSLALILGISSINLKLSVLLLAKAFCL